MKRILALILFISSHLIAQNDLEEYNINSSTHFISLLSTTEDSSFMPLRIGNLYQFIESGYGGGVAWSYLRYGTVSRDTLINEQKYYLYTVHNTNHWFRYPVSEKKLYAWYNEEEMLYMDFNKALGDTFIHLNYLYPATVLGGDINLFSQNFAYHGFSVPIINGSRRELFAQGLGLYYTRSENTIQIGNRTFSLIMAILNDSLGYTHQFTNHYEPVITINPITLINTGNFSLGFTVTHEFDRPAPPGHTPMFFISSVKLESYYSRQDSVIPRPLINATGIRNFNVNTTIDTMLMKKGFVFCYRIIAVDKGIIPETSYAPDTGYYKCVWNGPTGIDENSQTMSTFFLSQNYPNPFNPSTKISWQSPVGGWQTLKVYDVLGNEVAILVDEYRDAGSYDVEFNPASSIKNPASGIYFYQLKVGDPSSSSGQVFVETKKMILIR